jgi:hypothetical protein
MDLLYELMDQGLVDCNGERCGRVDDIEVEDCFDEPPRVTALLAGNGAKSRCLGRWAHRLSLWLHALLGQPRPICPVIIPWEQVDHVVADVVLKITADEAGLNGVNRAGADRFIRHIPGAHP